MIQAGSGDSFWTWLWAELNSPSRKFRSTNSQPPLQSLSFCLSQFYYKCNLPDLESVRSSEWVHLPRGLVIGQRAKLAWKWDFEKVLGLVPWSKSHALSPLVSSPVGATQGEAHMKTAGYSPSAEIYLCLLWWARPVWQPQASCVSFVNILFFQ